MHGKSSGTQRRNGMSLQDVPQHAGDHAHLRLHHTLLLRARLPLRLGLSVRVSLAKECTKVVISGSGGNFVNLINKLFIW